MKHTILLLLFMVLGFAVAVPAQAAPGTDERTEQPEEFTLSPAYPNPFNPRTSFTLSVEDRQNVTVDVYNLLGAQVQRLYQGVMEAGQPRTFTFTADHLPSGIYLYRVQGETFTATRQMTLLK